VWCLAHIEVGSVKTEVCDCKKKSENKSAKITKKL